MRGTGRSLHSTLEQPTTPAVAVEPARLNERRLVGRYGGILHFCRLQQQKGFAYLTVSFLFFCRPSLSSSLRRASRRRRASRLRPATAFTALRADVDADRRAERDFELLSTFSASDHLVLRSMPSRDARHRVDLSLSVRCRASQDRPQARNA
jgi:hypothetical protein